MLWRARPVVFRRRLMQRRGREQDHPARRGRQDEVGIVGGGVVFRGGAVRRAHQAAHRQAEAGRAVSRLVTAAGDEGQHLAAGAAPFLAPQHMRGNPVDLRRRAGIAALHRGPDPAQAGPAAAGNPHPHPRAGGDPGGEAGSRADPALAPAGGDRGADGLHPRLGGRFVVPIPSVQVFWAEARPSAPAHAARRRWRPGSSGTRPAMLRQVQFRRARRGGDSRPGAG
jgi:hypothetical protein